jgi:hypothetical protein
MKIWGTVDLSVDTAITAERPFAILEKSRTEAELADEEETQTFSLGPTNIYPRVRNPQKRTSHGAAGKAPQTQPGTIYLFSTLTAVWELIQSLGTYPPPSNPQIPSTITIFQATTSSTMTPSIHLHGEDVLSSSPPSYPRPLHPTY